MYNENYVITQNILAFGLVIKQPTAVCCSHLGTNREPASLPHHLNALSHQHFHSLSLCLTSHYLSFSILLLLCLTSPSNPLQRVGRV